MRYAIYFTPAGNDPLTQAAARWLGRDAFSGETFPLSEQGELAADEVMELTADPRRYGFHATLKAPFELRPGTTEEQLLGALEVFCAKTKPFDIPNVILGQIGAFFAVVPDRVYPELQSFAASIVETFEPFRAPLGEADIARRKPEKLTATQRDNLHAWGYPYVFDDFRFHMTLTGQVPADYAGAMRAVLLDRFSTLVDRPLPIDGLALFREDERGAPFLVQSRLPLSGA
ncbi:DUF1045 domain-containing protein [Pseudomonas sp. R2.Fl]|nr:DUF1045 domain-containing protein [Pseudomonas sp. R2.Fl]